MENQECERNLELKDRLHHLNNKLKHILVHPSFSEHKDLADSF